MIGSYKPPSGRGPVDSVGAKCDVLIQCLSIFVKQSKGDGDALIQRFVEECFSAKLVADRVSSQAEAPQSSASESVGRVIVKKRPSPLAIGCRQQVLQFFQAIEFFLGLFVVSEGVVDGFTVSEVVRSKSEDTVSQLCGECGACAIVEATFLILSKVGDEIFSVVEKSMRSPKSLHCTVVVDTYETYLSRAILVGSGVIGPVVPPGEKKHLTLLPWWLFLSSQCGMFSLKKEGWSSRMTRNVLFSITDSLVRQSISSSEHSRESLIGFSQAVRVGALSPSASLLPIAPLSGNMRDQTPGNSYREGLSVNGGAEALVNTFLHEMSVNAGYLTEATTPFASLSSGRRVSGKSPSPRGDTMSGSAAPRSPRYVSPSSSHFVGQMGDAVNPKKMRKLALQFAAKLGNLYATQDVHALLSFLPEKSSSPPIVLSAKQREKPADELVNDDEPSDSSSLSDASGSQRGMSNSNFSDGNAKETGDILKEKIFSFLRDSFTHYTPLAVSQTQQLSLFIALCLLSRIAFFSPPNFGRCTSARQREVAFGIQFGYEPLVWSLVVSTFLDTCTVGGMCAVLGERQIPLAKQLAVTVTSFMRHCYSDDFLHAAPKKVGLHVISRRWVPKCNFLVNEALGSCKRGNDRVLKHELLQHFYFLTFYLRSVLEENSTMEDTQSDAAERSRSPIRVCGGEEDGRFNVLKDILEEGNDVLQVLQKCMGLLPWSKVQNVAATDYPLDPAPTALGGHCLFPASEVEAPGTHHSDTDFVKFCVHYYLAVLDTFIEIALCLSFFPSYLTTVLLRFDESYAYLAGAGGGGLMGRLPLNSDKYERAGWQRSFNHHCLNIIKDGTQHVSIQFVLSLKHWERVSSCNSLQLYDSLHLDHIADYTPSPEDTFNHSWYFLRILNHAKNVVRYVCSKSVPTEGTSGGQYPTESSLVCRDAARFVDGVTPFLSTSSGTFTQSLSVPHQHPFLWLEEGAKEQNDSTLKDSLEAVCRDLWLRIQALQLLSTAAAPIRVDAVELAGSGSGRPVYILNGSASKTYVRLLFLRIVQSLFSQHGSYNDHLEHSLINAISAENKQLYALSKRLWTLCLTLSFQTIQSLSHHHTKARETAMHLGVHAVLSRLLDALSSNHLKNELAAALSQPEPLSASAVPQPSSTQDDGLEDTMLLDDSSPAAETTDTITEEAAPSVAAAVEQQLFSFSIPQLCLDGVAPALYFLSSGDTGEALQATLFPDNRMSSPSTKPVSEAMSPVKPAAPVTPVNTHLKTVSPVVPPLSLTSSSALNDFPAQRSGSRGDIALPDERCIINQKALFHNSALLSCAVSCTCSLLVQHSGMLRYESTVSIAPLRKRLHLPEASYHLLYGGDQTWKKYVEDTRNSATLKNYLGSCCSDQRGIRPSFVFRSLRNVISFASSGQHLNALERWLDLHSLTYYRDGIVTSKCESRWRHIAALKMRTTGKEARNVSSAFYDDGSLHSVGVFVLLRLLIPTRNWNQQFDFHHRLGAGGFGTVMAADYRERSEEISSSSPREQLSQWVQEERKALQRNPLVAIKMMPLLLPHDADSGMLPMCHAEVLAMMCLRGSPHIVPLISFGSSDDGYFIVLPRYAAGSLHDWRLRQYPPGCAALVHTNDKNTSNGTGSVGKGNTLLNLCCPLITQLLEAVTFMHSHHIRHNDVKAENLLVDATDAASVTDSDAAIQPAFQQDLDIVLPRSIRLGDFGSCDTCTDEDIQELLRDLVAGESRFMEGRWGFGKGTEAVQPPEIIAPRWRYELMRAIALRFVGSKNSRPRGSKQPLATSFAAVRKQPQNEESGDMEKFFEVLRKIELSADIWSCGCLVYELLTGGMLFGEGKLGRLTALATAAREQLAEKNKLSRLSNWNELQWVSAAPALDHWDMNDLVDAVGTEIVNFILELLSVDPLRRPTAPEALEKWKNIAKNITS